MATKKKPANFPLFFYNGSRKEAQRRADEDYRGNLTAYLNALVKADINSHAVVFARLAKATRAAEAHYKKLKADARKHPKEGRTKKSKP